MRRTQLAWWVGIAGGWIAVASVSEAQVSEEQVSEEQGSPSEQPPSAAQLERARTEFRAGVAATRAEQWPDAERHFRAAYEIAEAPAVLVNLALVADRRGRMLEAASLYRAYLEANAGNERLTSEVQSALTTIRTETPRLRVDVSNLQDGDEVQLDGVQVAPSDEVSVDPGRHRVRVVRGSQELAGTTVDVARGRQETVRLLVPAPEARALPTVTAPPSTVSSLSTDPIEENDNGLVIGLAIGGATLALLTAAAVVLTIVLTAPQPTQGSLGGGILEVGAP